MAIGKTCDGKIRCPEDFDLHACCSSLPSPISRTTPRGTVQPIGDGPVGGPSRWIPLWLTRAHRADRNVGFLSDDAPSRQQRYDRDTVDPCPAEPRAAGDRPAPGPVQIAAAAAGHQLRCAGRPSLRQGSRERPSEGNGGGGDHADQRLGHRGPDQRLGHRGPAAATATAATGPAATATSASAAVAAAAAATTATSDQAIQSAAAHQMHFRAAGRGQSRELRNDDARHDHVAQQTGNVVTMDVRLNWTSCMPNAGKQERIVWYCDDRSSIDVLAKTRLIFTLTTSLISYSVRRASPYPPLLSPLPHPPGTRTFGHNVERHICNDYYSIYKHFFFMPSSIKTIWREIHLTLHRS